MEEDLHAPPPQIRVETPTAPVQLRSSETTGYEHSALNGPAQIIQLADHSLFPVPSTNLDTAIKMLSYFGWGSSSKPDSTTTTTTQQDKTITDLPINQQLQSSASAQPPSEPQQPSQPPLSQTHKPKENTGLKLLLGGIAFSALSIWITRRASIKKRLGSIPPYYSSSIYHQPQVNGAMEAFEALNLATINVFSFGIMTTGAVMYALDVNGLEDMRRIMRGGLEGAAAGKSDEELEREVTEWVTSVMGNRFEKQLEKERAKKRQDGPGEKGN